MWDDKQNIEVECKEMNGLESSKLVKLPVPAHLYGSKTWVMKNKHGNKIQ